jgi:hypothetical protein
VREEVRVQLKCGPQVVHGRAELKHPAETNFEVKKSEANVVAAFRPTNSTYTFSRLADQDDIARQGPISREPIVWHAKGDTGDYVADEVLCMAYALALRFAL